jgi:OOP family OmpA-OmpF porin
MTKHHKKLLALAAIASLGLSASTAFAQDVVVDGTGEIPYAIDGRKVVTRSGAGLCWRTGYWTAAAAENAPAGEFPVGCGCDGDIVPKDKCEAAVVAATPEPEPVKDDPGPDVKEVAQTEVKLNADVLFDFNQATLKPEGRTALSNVASQAKDIRLEVIVVVGHTDRIGADIPNQRLSERRAASVKSFLVEEGIEASRIHTEGRGRTQPVTGTDCNNVTPRTALISCLQPDRRVDIEIVGTR